MTQAVDDQPLVLVETADLSRDEWLSYRRQGLGGSDAAAVLGISPFRTARDLYYDKRGLPIEDDESMIQDDILKVSMFLPKMLRLGARDPAFNLFIDRKARRFLTYGYENKKWLTGKLDRIDWGYDNKTLMDRWISPSDAELVKEYLGTEKGTYWDILNYQQCIRHEELMRRHKKETDPWDADMALTPDLPKDWEHWVDKVGIPENYIFYVYKKGGAKQGYCSYCGKDVPIRGIPRNNQKGHCTCCRHEITYKAVGRLGYHLDSKEVCVYLLQSRPDGFVVREFWASRRYTNGDYQNPEISCAEHWRTIYDRQMDRRFYYWGKYKQCDMRWISGMPSSSWMGYNSIYNYRGSKPGRIYGKTLPHLAKVELKPTGLVAWIQAHGMVANPDDYLTILRNVPQFEQIWKADLPQLMEECLKDSSSVRDAIKAPQESSLTRALGISKQELGRLRRYNGGCFLLRWLQVEKESGKAISDEVLQWFSDQQIKATDLNFIWGSGLDLVGQSLCFGFQLCNHGSHAHKIVGGKVQLSNAHKNFLSPRVAGRSAVLVVVEFLYGIGREIRFVLPLVEVV